MAFGWSSKYIIWYFTWPWGHFECLFGLSSTLDIEKNTCLPSQMSTVSGEQNRCISANHILSDKINAATSLEQRLI